MIKVRGLDHAAICVSDLDVSLKFYTEVLGLEITRREPSKPGQEYFLNCGASLVGLIQGDPQGERHLLQPGGLGGDHFSFRVSAAEFDQVRTELLDRGVDIAFYKKREKSWSIYFYDPDRNKLEITAWPEEDLKV